MSHGEIVLLGLILFAFVAVFVFMAVMDARQSRRQREREQRATVLTWEDVGIETQATCVDGSVYRARHGLILNTHMNGRWFRYPSGEIADYDTQYRLKHQHALYRRRQRWGLEWPT